MPVAARKRPPLSRAATKALRRRQLVDSTIESIARRGLAETTLADVAEGAGLSHGSVNFHFRSKDALFVAALHHLAEEYRAVWRRARDAAGDDPAKRLAAMVSTGFDPAVCTRKKLAVWFAFWGEARSRPTYLAVCAAFDREFLDALAADCAALVEASGYAGVDARAVARALSAMTDGLWLDLLFESGDIDRARARAVCFGYLATVFPRHFGAARETASGSESP